MSYRLLSKTPPTSNGPGPASTLNHILDDDSLLNIFSLCRPLILDESEASNVEILEGGKWNRERWWYTLVHVCRRWRYLVLGSPSHLRLSLLCAHRTPVADMLANSPPLPLIIDHLDENIALAPEDEQGIILALQHHDRVRRIRLRNPIPNLQRLVLALDGKYPILEFMLIQHQSYLTPTNTNDTIVSIPETFQAPHLRHLVLMNFDIPIGSPLLMTMANLVTLSLDLIPPSAYFHPNALLQRILLMPHLKTLGIFFGFHSTSGEIERQSSHMPIMTRVTLPNLLWFGLKGASAYLEALLPWVAFPLLEKLHIYFSNQLTYSIPHLQQYMSAARSFRPISIVLIFHEYCLDMTAHSYKGALTYFLSMALDGSHVNWQVASAAEVFNALGTVFSAVEHLTLRYDRNFVPSVLNNEANRALWRELLELFSKVKTILVDDELVEQLSHSLRPDEGESPMEPLPGLQELSYHSRDASYDAFAQFFDARQEVRHPITVVHH